jgi:hypothetical protein
MTTPEPVELGDIFLMVIDDNRHHGTHYMLIGRPEADEYYDVVCLEDGWVGTIWETDLDNKDRYIKVA